MHVWQQSLLNMAGTFLAVFIGAGLGGCVGLFLFSWFTTPFPK